jgi:hypothetical protein
MDPGGFQMVSFLGGFEDGSRQLLKVWGRDFKNKSV